MITLVQFADVWMDVGGIDESGQCHLEERHKAMLQIENNHTNWFFSSLGLFFVLFLLGAVANLAVGGSSHQFAEIVSCAFGVAVGSGFTLYRRGKRNTKLLATMLAYCLSEHKNFHCAALIRRRMVRSKVLAGVIEESM